MGANWVRKWAGGRVRAVGEREVFVIERHRRVITLTATSEPEALAELALFLRDPGAYRTRSEDPGAVRLNADTLGPFLADCVRRGLTEEYRKTILRKYLQTWGKDLEGRDLRRVTLRDLSECLDSHATARKPRIIALKAFTAWLRETGRLAHAEDASLSLMVPPPRSKKTIEARGYSREVVEKVYAMLTTQYVRDLFVLRAKLGMHHTEIDRLARGKGVLRRVDDPSGIVGTATFPHKVKTHVVSMDAQTFAAAERLQAAKRAPHGHTVEAQLDRIAKALELKHPLNEGELRHTFSTLATTSGVLVQPKGAGVPLDEVARVMGHTTPRTTQIYYLGARVPPMIRLPLKLYHPDDPIPFRGTASSSAAS